MKLTSLLSKYGLSEETAFQDSRVAVKPIPCDWRGCPLGLYDPDTGGVTLPPNYTEGAVLHEAGHRYGHYYYNDLSEGFAEAFRGHFLPETVTYLGGGKELSEVGALLSPGQRGYLMLRFSNEPTRDLLQKVNAPGYYMLPDGSYGIPLMVTGDVAWIQLAALGLGALSAGWLGFLAWRAEEKITTAASKNILPLALLGAATVLGYVYLSRRK